MISIAFLVFVIVGGIIGAIVFSKKEKSLSYAFPGFAIGGLVAMMIGFIVIIIAIIVTLFTVPVEWQLTH